MTSPKRHLPLVGQTPSVEQAPTSAWLWSFLGGLVTLATWAPAALIITLVMGKLAPKPPWSAGLMLIGALALLGTFAFSCALGGALVGRFCEQPGRTTAGSSGLWGLSFVLLLAALGHALRPLTVGLMVGVCLLAIAWPLATLGGRWGRRRRSVMAGGDGDHVQSPIDPK